MFELNNFDSIQIGVASPTKIRSWSRGEVTKPETINYRTLKPEKDGLFCEKIFGPTKDWECRCGRYKRVRYKGVVCEKCGVEVTRKDVRRERMGHIELAAPVSHIWYFRGVPSRISIAVDMPTKDVDQVLYFAKYIVTDPMDTDLLRKQIISEEEYREYQAQYGKKAFEAKMGAEAIKELLSDINLDKEIEELKELIEINQGQKRIKYIKRLDLLESFKESKARPEWMILDVLPVLPPELRPLITLDGGRVACADLNELYRRVIIRNNTLKNMIDKSSPAIMINNAKRLLQEAVDALIDNGRRGKPVVGSGNRELKSLTEKLRGKQGRFRQNLLGKRVDYSARSVIVVGPELKMYQCGLPKEIALELFSPFVINVLMEQGKCKTGKVGKQMIERGEPYVWDILEKVIKDHPVLLNRAPTLHRLGIQAFEPVLVEGRAIKLHPLACSGFNADFDGDQMAVHLPLSIEAQAEARFLMLSTNNILKLSDGKPVVSPTQDMVLGTYYLTLNKPGAKGEGRYFMSFDEAIMAYQLKQIELQAMIHVRSKKTIDGVDYQKMLHTTVGRIMFNEYIPQDLGLAKRDTVDQLLDLEIDYVVTKKELSQIVDACFKKNGATETARVLDNIKKNGYKFSTISGITANVFDMVIPPEKYEIIEKADEHALKVETEYKRGRLTNEGRYEEVIKIWSDAKKEVDDKLFDNLGTFNPVRMMEQSGARGKKEQISQLCGMRGLVRDPSGRTVELPIKASYREGLSVLEYFISSHGGRKGLADTALKTANSGYLTRRLVEISHDVIITEEDCGDTKGIIVKASPNQTQTLANRVAGRYSLETIVDPKTKEVIVEANTLISDEQASMIEKAKVESVKIRSVLTCKCRNGCCSKCYGQDMSTLTDVKLGEAVGIVAAQSIGEPGTQLTMRNFHSGGIALGGDITKGLPRVEELFEARKPKGEAIISEIAGIIDYNNEKKRIIVQAANGDSREYFIPYTQKSLVTTGTEVKPGTVLSSGSINLQALLRTSGPRNVQEYIIEEVQSVYKSAGVEINDKHLEIIIRQMLRKVKIETQGDTNMLPGQLIDLFTYDSQNERIISEGKQAATAKRTLLGITKAALATESFLSAASFQETAKVLTEAAIKNKVDPLIGLKENIILGKQIPAGTGMKIYRNAKAGSPDEINIQVVESDQHIDMAYLEDEFGVNGEGTV